MATIRTSGEKRIETIALLDTGANQNFISADVAAGLNLAPTGAKSNATMANGTKEEILGQVSIEVELKKTQRAIGREVALELHCNVIKNAPAPLVIGAATLLDADLIYTCIALSDSPDPEMDDTDEDLFAIGSTEPKEIQAASDVQAILDKYEDVFGPAGDTPARLPMFRLDTVPDAHVSLRPYRRARDEEKAMEQVLDENRHADIIEPTTSSWGSPALLVAKKSGKWRLVADYRRLNELTKRFDYPIPIIDDILTELGDSKYYCTLDLSSGYFQVPIHPDDRDKTTMVTPFGRFRYKRMPMGLRNAGSHFQWAMEQALAEFLHRGVVVYLDDIIIHAKSRDEMLELLDKVFERLRKLNIKVGRDKCVFDATEVEYLGWKISQGKKSITSDRYKALQRLVAPKSKKGAQSLLGFVNFMNEHIPELATSAKPIRECCATEPFVWSPDAAEALQQLKHDAVRTLGRYDPAGSPLVLMTDASNIGLGGVILQDGVPLRYISHSFNKIEANWSTYEQECYALVYCCRVAEKMLRWRPFMIKTDHKNLTYIERDHHSKVGRWKVFLSRFDFAVEHVAGIENGGADGLSRLFAAGTAPEDRDDIIGAVHNAAVGHLPTNITVARLRNLGHTWRGIRDDVHNFIGRCPICAKETGPSGPDCPQLQTDIGRSPMDHIAVDTMGPIRSSDGEPAYVVVIIDTFSRFTELYPARATTAAEAVKSIVEWSCRYGAPTHITSDGGSQYKNSLVRKLTGSGNISHHITTPYHPESNGRVERVNKDIGKHLRMLLATSGNDWKDLLPRVQFIINNTQKEVLGGLTPAEVVFGRDQRALDQTLLATLPDRPSWQGTGQIRIIAAITEAIVKTKVQDDLKVPEAAAEWPAYVLVEYPGGKPPSKLTPRFRGPMRFVGPASDTVPPATFLVEDLLTKNVLQIHGTRMKPWKGPEDATLLRKFALWDSPDEFEIERIVEHRRGDHGLQFRVRWAGYEPAEDSWLPTSGVSQAAALDAYLGELKLTLEQLRRRD